MGVTEPMTSAGAAAHVTLADADRSRSAREGTQDIKRIILIEGSSHNSPSDTTPLDENSHNSPNDRTTGLTSEIDRGLSGAEAFFKATYDYIRRSTLVTAWMSGVIFIVGLALLVLASVQAMQGQVPSTAIALAASGLGAIAVALQESSPANASVGC
jgi:hypothetical protein